MERNYHSNGKVGIIYDSKEDWAISYFKKEFEKKNMDVCLFNANQIPDKYSEVINNEELVLPSLQKKVGEGYNIWMNRIYPSESSPYLVNKGLNIISWLGARNLHIVNSLTASAADYDKYYAYELMKKYEVPTPKTEKVEKGKSLDSYLENFSFPLIVKKNTGGKGLGVTKVNTMEEFSKLISAEEVLSGNYLIQEFMKPSKDFDVRVGVVNGKPLISYARSLVKKNGEADAWMGSCNHGSAILEYEASDEEKRLAVSTSNALGANLNEVDIQITDKGPVVIENNLTPGYDEGEEKWVRLIVDHIYNKYHS